MLAGEVKGNVLSSTATSTLLPLATFLELAGKESIVKSDFDPKNQNGRLNVHVAFSSLNKTEFTPPPAL
jgi:hypothetical protein